MTIARRAFFLACFPLLGALRAQLPPGYDGTFPSAAAQQVLRELTKTRWEDTKKVAGGGTWQLHDGGVTPHALGPCRGDVMDVHAAETKGPHLRLVREHLAICLPTTTDGDVAATLRWLGRAVPAGVAGEPTAAWRTALARVEGLGAETEGFRLGIALDAERPDRITLVVWKTGLRKSGITGHLALRVGSAELPLQLEARPADRRDDGRSSFLLKLGATFVHEVDVAALLRANGGDPADATTHALQLVMRVDVASGPRPELTSARISQRRAPVPKPRAGG